MYHHESSDELFFETQCWSQQARPGITTPTVNAANAMGIDVEEAMKPRRDRNVSCVFAMCPLNDSTSEFINQDLLQFSETTNELINQDLLSSKSIKMELSPPTRNVYSGAGHSPCPTSDNTTVNPAVRHPAYRKLRSGLWPSCPPPRSLLQAYDWGDNQSVRRASRDSQCLHRSSTAFNKHPQGILKGGADG
ncbi:unnamed protein product [Sympodiomycopsis kandeliae]